MRNQTIPAEAGGTCHCCGRTHRKLYLTDGYWMGKSCTEDYRLYTWYPDPNNITWRGYEKTYTKVHRMVSGH